MTFHGLGPPHEHVRPSEAAVWVDATDFEDALERIAAGTGVRVTFDDGNRSDVGVALPMLEARGLSATFFVVARRIGESGFLDRDDLRELARAGMRVGSHGLEHRDWRGLDDSALEDELVLSRRELEAAVGVTVSEAACPFGSYDRRVLRGLRAAGYGRVYTSDGGWSADGRWLQARNTMRAGLAATSTEQLLRGPTLRDRVVGTLREVVKRSR